MVSPIGRAPTITIIAAPHTVDAAMADVRAVAAQPGPLEDCREIEPSSAVTIAALWQSPGSVGRALAGLASGATVRRSDVLADIYRTRPEVVRPLDHVALDCLATFVLNFQRFAAVDTDR